VSKDHDLLKKIEEGLGQDDLGEPNYFGPYGTIAAFNHGDEWVKEMNEYVFNNKRYINDFIQRELPKLHLVDNKATYLLWLDISAYTNDSEEFAKRLREETGLFVSPGMQFGDGGESFLRINVATSLKNVKDACNRLKQYILSL
jgi:cystathionine beta-lyase